MRAVLQRVSRAKVTVDAETTGEIGRGLLVLLGVGVDDEEADATYLVDKTLNLREMRVGQENFRRAKGRYGTLEELTGDGLITPDLADGKDWGYDFELRVTPQAYEVNADPEPRADGRRSGNRLFMDESGIIRASNDSTKRADRNSEAIRNQ